MNLFQRIYVRCAVIITLTLSVTAAAANPPVKSPRPETRPEVEVAVVTRAATVVSAAAIHRSLRPEKRPKSLRRGQRAQKVAYRTQPVPEASTGRNGALCGDPAIVGKTIPPIKAKLKGCGLKDGVSVIAVSGVALTRPASMDCTTAKSLKNWVESGVKPVFARKGGGVTALQVAAGYSCRGRNNKKGARISEHGKGRAIDISALLLANGTRVTVEKGWGSSAYGKQLKKVRKAACGPFNTVLGPGSDRHHHDHFHLDTARGRGPYCR